MSNQNRNCWVALSPPFPDRGVSQRVLQKHAASLLELSGSENAGDLDDALEAVLSQTGAEPTNTPLRAALCLLTDLARQRWSIRLAPGGTVEVKRPAGDLLDPKRDKARVRAQELVKRDEQLREPATRKFIEGMEKKTIHEDRFVSIFSLIRDGRELARALREVRSLEQAERVLALREVTNPYLQFVDDAEHCEHTGLRLRDIWRYFRHTWTNQYTTTPGRSMAFLVRDRARDFDPVIGIGAIGSSIVQIRERDTWIGWHPEAFIERVTESHSAEIGSWLQKAVTTAIEELYVDDFFEEQLLTPPDIRDPSPAIVNVLLEHGARQRELHHRLANSQDLKRSAERDENGSTKAHWQARARTHLFRSKRALSLADMLRSRMVLQQHLSAAPTVDEVRDLLASAAGRSIVKKVLRKAKADRVGIAMADITVCGAIAPYSPILGGKLVSMLAVSPEVVTAYRNKYLEQESEIASSMAGRPIVRPSQLVFFGTTSLYGVGSSQYNRLRMPAERIGGEPGERLEYVEIGKSEAFGTSHFTSDTVNALVSLVQQSSNGQRVNSIFGEGVSPKLRKIRDGLDALKLPADALLQHGRNRIVYGVPVIRNLREFLLGMDDHPDYIFDMGVPNELTAEISRWWTERWLSRRIESDVVLSQVEGHTLVRPVRHGARVVLPRKENGQLCLFDDLDY
jgi:hypothetical protein